MEEKEIDLLFKFPTFKYADKSVSDRRLPIAVVENLPHIFIFER
ncbi:MULTISPECIES: hypothetical protein [Nostocales]|uniref:Uncharacterized protein n=2 Tax=Nostocales TaxID=1161 RepID=A0ABW8WYK3_9CYAN|nr:hypothetical protein [Tolypothrix bouteillei]